MARSEPLIDDASDDIATPIEFELTRDDFRYGFPALKSRGLSTDDVINIYEMVNGELQDTGVDLDETNTSTVINSPGKYGIDLVHNTSTSIHCQLDSSYGSGKRGGF